MTYVEAGKEQVNVKLALLSSESISQRIVSQSLVHRGRRCPWDRSIIQELKHAGLGQQDIYRRFATLSMLMLVPLRDSSSGTNMHKYAGTIQLNPAEISRHLHQPRVWAEAGEQRCEMRQSQRSFSYAVADQV
ncbi:hypothetical protein E4U52_006633 [Claviceps spartinae]|nr:hypothetical protein E4U52_006633 [Claviceps spartinae]